MGHAEQTEIAIIKRLFTEPSFYFQYYIFTQSYFDLLITTVVLLSPPSISAFFFAGFD